MIDTDDHYAELRAAVERLPANDTTDFDVRFCYEIMALSEVFSKPTRANAVMLACYASVIIAARRLVEARGDTDQ